MNLVGVRPGEKRRLGLRVSMDAVGGACVVEGPVQRGQFFAWLAGMAGAAAVVDLERLARLTVDATYFQDAETAEGSLRVLEPAPEPAAGADWSVNARVVDRARILRGWTPAELARVAHMDPRTVRSVIAGRRRPTLGSVQAMCVALGLSLADVVVFGDDEL